MKSWKDLPSEVLEMIFKTFTDDELYFSRKRNLRQCALVCRLWSLPARRVLYSTIELDSEMTAIKLITAVRMNNEQQSFGKLVRSLSVNIPATAFTYIIYMPHFVTIFPFLEHLKASGHGDRFYQSLISAEDTDSTWKYLKSIPKPLLNTSIQYYITFTLKHAKTLTSILLCDNVTTISFSPNSSIHTHQFDRLASKLNQFENLTHLQLEKFSTESIEFFDNVIQSCQSLQTLNFNIRPITISFDEEAPSRTEPIDFTSIVARLEIKIVRGLAVIYSDKSLLYLIKKYPQLDKLYLNDYMESGEEEDVIYIENDRCTLTPTSVAKFLSYITRIPFYSVKFHIPVNILDEALAQHGAMSPTALHNVDVSYERENDLHYAFPESSNTPNAMFEAKNSGSTVKKCRVVYETLNVFRLPPHRYLIEKFGRYIGQMNFSLGTGHIPGIPNSTALGYCLDHTFKYCTRLRHLTISNSTFIFVIQDSIFTDSSLTDLVLEDVIMMNHNTLSAISKTLPSLKNLTLKSCKFIQNNSDDSVACSNGSIQMPNTSFEHLYIGDGFVSGSFKFSALYLKIHTTSKGDNNTFFKFGYEYATGKYEPTHCSMNEYEEKLEDKCFINMFVACASVKTIRIEYRCFSCQTTII